MKVIGLTGGIASGKTTVARMIRQIGIPIICADRLAHQVVKPGCKAYQDIVKTFGRSILNKNATINRAKLGMIIFDNEKKRQRLNAIVHPEVMNVMKDQMTKLEKRGTKSVVLDIPLLYEEGLDTMCNEVIMVYAPVRQLKQRLIIRDKLDETQVNKRLKAQMSIEEKKKRAEHLVNNSGDLTKTQEQVERLLRQIC